MDPAIARALTSNTVTDLLASLPPYDPNATLSLATRLRSEGLSPELVAAVQTQLAVRDVLRSKMGTRADRLLATRDGAEQATRWPVARLRAATLAAAGAHHVADLTCGLGIDTLAFADAGMRVTAAELDEATAVLAAHNTRDFPTVRVEHGNGLAIGGGIGSQPPVEPNTHPPVEPVETPPVDAIFADPARRTATGTRINDPEHYSPPLSSVWELRNRVPLLAVKVGPGIKHHQIPADADAQWLSVDGDVVEATLWWRGTRAAASAAANAAATDSTHAIRHTHTAIVATSNPADPAAGDLTTAVLSGIPDGQPGAPELGVLTDPDDVPPIIAEPDGAIIRAHLLGTLALEATENSSSIAPRLISAHIAYLAAYAPVPLSQNFRVIEILPFHIKKLSGYLRERGVGSVTIKKRGVDATPEQVRKQLRLRGDGSATLILTRVAGQHRSIVVEPVGGENA